jgi:hypothetical protein
MHQLWNPISPVGVVAVALLTGAHGVTHQRHGVNRHNSPLSHHGGFLFDPLTDRPCQPAEPSRLLVRSSPVPYVQPESKHTDRFVQSLIWFSRTKPTLGRPSRRSGTSKSPVPRRVHKGKDQTYGSIRRPAPPISNP